MNKYNATIIKTGNSYALRVPKAYIVDNNLKLGQKTQITTPISTHSQNHERIKTAFVKLKKIKAFGTISNPVEWQKEQRQDRNIPNRV